MSNLQVLSCCWSNKIIGNSQNRRYYSKGLRVGGSRYRICCSLPKKNNNIQASTTLEKEHIDISQEDSAYDMLQHQLKDVMQGHAQASQEVLELNSKLLELEESLSLLNQKGQDFQESFQVPDKPKKKVVTSKTIKAQITKKLSSSSQEEGSVDRKKVRKVRTVKPKPAPTKKSNNQDEKMTQSQLDELEGSQTMVRSKRQRRTQVQQSQAETKRVSSMISQQFRKNGSSTIHDKLKISKLLKAEDEKELNLLVKQLLKFESAKEEYKKRHRREPNDIEWAAICGYNYAEFVQDLETCRDAKQRFVEANMRLVMSVARKFVNSEFTIHELVQDGIQGLIRAVEKFDGLSCCRGNQCQR
eukprot:TRINITY_DN10166_c0_g1_i12.p1 TRINITY_DN10166_c0_g1~~TRINITY_DN10166_c0_g1_i12.p1  ORF type:complete len:382 (+),score=45.92 TRINITY_DN10166_c0_g1_i12:74-1147(+)